MAEQAEVKEEIKVCPFNGKSPICGARTQRGTPCLNAACANGRCRKHGGKTPHGLASPHTKHGRYSKYLPKGLIEKYQEAESDEELLSARADVALLQGRISELAERLAAQEGEGTWRELRKTWEGFEGACLPGDAEAQKVCLDRMRVLVRQGSSQEALWSELVGTIREKTKVSQAEWKRLSTLRQVITAEQATLFTMRLLDVVLLHVPEPDRRRKIAMEVQGLLLAKEKADPGVTDAEFTEKSP